jgi:hypothetical protein
VTEEVAALLTSRRWFREVTHESQNVEEEEMRSLAMRFSRLLPILPIESEETRQVSGPI